MMTHPFFQAIDWDSLGQRHVIPPFIPEQKEYSTKSAHVDFDTMLTDLSKKRAASGQFDVDWKEEVADSDQKLFSTWDFVSPHTLKVEMGIAGEMEAHDTNFKVQQIMGSSEGAVSSGGNSPTPNSRGLVGSLKKLTPVNTGRELMKRMSLVGTGQSADLGPDMKNA
jgi:hypothetical protein